MAIQIFKRKQEHWITAPAQALNVANIDSSVISASINVEESVVGQSPARLLVLIRNEGDKKVKNILMVLKAPAGVVIVNPGEVFGIEEKRHKTGAITAHQNIRYKIDLKSRPEFRGGEIVFELRDPASAESEDPYFTINLPLSVHSI
jgi:hypothetical protein